MKEDIFENQNNRPQSKYLVENCFKLSLSDFGKNLLAGKKGKFVLIRKLNLLKCEYDSDFTDPPRVLITFIWNGITRRQTIKLDTEVISFGVRPYFLCGCDHRANVLYFRPDHSPYFACRECLNLHYELTTMNRKALGGELFYRNNRALKLLGARDKVKTILYNGKMTHKAKRVLEMTKKWGLNQQAMEIINSQIAALSKK